MAVPIVHTKPAVPRLGGALNSNETIPLNEWGFPFVECGTTLMSMKTTACTLSALACFLGVSVGWAERTFGQEIRRVEPRKDSGASPLLSASNLSREKDAVYVEDFLRKPLRLKVVKEAVVYNNLAAERRLGVIPAGRLVSVVALSEKAYRVRGRAEHDDVSGWIGKANLETLDPKVTENLNKMIERQKLVDELIKRKEVALGMTSAEVEQVLGTPTKRSSRVDKEGRQEVYEYITYKQVPQQTAQRDATGRLFYATIYVKVESGRKTVTLQNDVVSSLEESEGLAPGAARKIVPLPVEIDLLQQ